MLVKAAPSAMEEYVEDYINYCKPKGDVIHMTLISQIRQCIEEKLRSGSAKKFIIFPFGDIGMQVKNILNNAYSIKEAYILDNNLCKFNVNIRELSFLDNIDCRKFYLILACTNPDIYPDLKAGVKKYFQEEDIAEFYSIPIKREKISTITEQERINFATKIGKHSFGPICKNHVLIESIGAFCSFAVGVDVVMNHEMQYITTSLMIYAGADLEKFTEFTQYKNREWYIEGVQPKKEMIKKIRRIRIGNDVWLGRNVIITNYSNIGNGVIAGAGCIITRDIPDYAIIGGVPAKVIRYRYLPEQIECLNRIQWWNWSDETIKERYDDFYLPIDIFISKYL